MNEGASSVSGAGNVFLIGPMGSGKTAVGRQLARDLGVEFKDSDAEIERRTGVDINFIFEKEGEERFREREKAVVADLVERRPLVLATGGGTVMDADNRRLLTANGTIVYLKTSVKQQIERTGRARKRPLLLNDDPAAVLERLMEVRGPLYEEIAHITVDTGGQKVGSVVEKIKAGLAERGPLKK